jgi:selenide,water dikinase
VLEGGKKVCHEAGIPLAGGHSIDAPEPIFGLAVTGKVPVNHLKKNKDGKVGDLLYLTKPLGIGVVTTAQKKKLVDHAHLETARTSMLTLNKIGQELGRLAYVNALTDVTGFGLGGHLLEVCEASDTSAVIYRDRLPVFDFVEKYIALNCIPGGTNRNWKSYGHKIGPIDDTSWQIIADPQTSGGLLISVDGSKRVDFERFMMEHGFSVMPIGRLVEKQDDLVIKVKQMVDNSVLNS